MGDKGERDKGVEGCGKFRVFSWELVSFVMCVYDEVRLIGLIRLIEQWKWKEHVLCWWWWLPYCWRDARKENSRRTPHLQLNKRNPWWILQRRIRWKPSTSGCGNGGWCMGGWAGGRAISETGYRAYEVEFIEQIWLIKNKIYKVIYDYCHGWDDGNGMPSADCWGSAYRIVYVWWEKTVSHSETRKDYTPYKAPKPLKVSEAVPQWTLESFDGNAVSLADLRGKIVLIDF